MDYSAQIEKFFSPCPQCRGLGFVGENLGETTQICSLCRGVGLALNLPDRDLVLSLPFFVDFRGRVRSFLNKVFLLLLSSIFILGVPYLIYIYVLQFVGNLKRI